MMGNDSFSEMCCEHMAASISDVKAMGYKNDDEALLGLTRLLGSDRLVDDEEDDTCQNMDPHLHQDTDGDFELLVEGQCRGKQSPSPKASYWWQQRCVYSM